MGCSVYSKEELLDNVCIDNKWYYVAELYTSNGYFFYRNAFEPMGKSIVIKCSKNSKAIFNEYNFLKSVKHNNIVNLLGYTFKDRTNVIGYDIDHYSPLSDHVKKNIVNTQDNYYILYELCNTIQYIHDHGYIVCNLSLDSILLRTNKIQDGFVLINFENAIKMNSAIEMFRANFGLYSLGYCSPELFYNHFIGKKTDVWSIGVISFVLCHRYLPYSPELYNSNRKVSTWKMKPMGCPDKTISHIWINTLELSHRKRYSIKHMMRCLNKKI